MAWMFVLYQTLLSADGYQQTISDLMASVCLSPEWEPKTIPM